MSHLTNLEDLSLNGNSISDADLDNVKSLKSRKGISIYETKATQEGVWALDKALPDCSILTDWN